MMQIKLPLLKTEAHVTLKKKSKIKLASNYKIIQGKYAPT
jgi:hypothetical protein